MNQTLKELLPHIYFILAFMMAFLAIEKVTPFADQYGTYMALIEWLYIFGFICLLGNRKKDDFLDFAKRDK